MISNVKFNELSSRVEAMSARIVELESAFKSLVATQGGEIPPGMSPVTTLAAEYGISTKKAEELAQNSGVMLIRHKAGGWLVHTERFREAAQIVLRSAKRKIGSSYWYHPLIGKFQMSGGISK